MNLISKNKRFLGVVFWLWLTIILYLTVVPNGHKFSAEIKDHYFRIDYILHFFVYFGLSVLFFLWKTDRFYKVKLVNIIYFLIGGLILSFLSEFAQHYIPGRSFNLIDFYSNSAGVIIGIITPKIFLKIYTTK